MSRGPPRVSVRAGTFWRSVGRVPAVTLERTRHGADESSGVGEALEGQWADGQGVGAETGVNPSTLSFWSWKLGSEQREGRRTSTIPSPHSRKRGAEPKPKREKPAARLVEVSTVVTSSPQMLEVVLGSRARVRVPAGFDEVTLTRVVRAVEAAR